VPTKVPVESKLTILQSERFKKLTWLVHGFSTRTGGSSRAYGGNALNLGFTKTDTRAAVERNRSIFFAQLGVGGPHPWPLATVRQVHSDPIHAVSSVPEQPLAGDGLITNTPGLLLAVLTADCIPVIVVDAKKRAVGVFHAGWRGTVKRIVEKGVGEMHRHFGSRTGDMEAAIGPGVHNCCYNVGEEVRQNFESQFGYASELFHEVKESDPVREKYPLLFLTARAPGHSNLPVHIFLNLVEANRRQLLGAGLRPSRIEASPLCTSCNTELLFSHRAERGITGRMMAVVGIRPTQGIRA
jgi:purine-nucleoside/S-methyl-5'-thioadenosine phosphorylase / adenosine deaminase